MEIGKAIELKSRVLETRPVNWQKFGYIQQDDFKEWSEQTKAKLKASIINNSFTQPFYVWQDPLGSVIYCLDGRHRTLILEELMHEGYNVPMLLPATFIHCADKKEAAHLVLVYSSIYARITQQGLFDFIEMYELKHEELSDVINLPEMEWDKFIGDQVKDFSTHNEELDPGLFGSEMVLKLTFSKESYLEVRTRLNELKEKHGLTENEEVILKLLDVTPAV